MNRLKIGLLILMLPLVAFTTAHKYYISVTNISYSEKDDALQITTRLFIDDLEKLLRERYGIEAHLATEKEAGITDEYLEKYIRAKLVIEINGEAKAYEYIGKKYDNDVVVFYLEVPRLNFPSVKSIQIENELLTDLFDEQQNIVHFKIDGKKRSYVLMRGNTKGVLNL